MKLLNELKNEISRTLCAFLQIYYCQTRDTWNVHISLIQKVEDKSFNVAIKKALYLLKARRNYLGKRKVYTL